MAQVSQQSRGFDLSRLDELTPEEIEANQTYYNTRQGRAHVGLDLWIENGIGVLKRWRLFASLWTPSIDQLNVTDRPWRAGFGFLPLYAQIGYVAGVRYLVHGAQHRSGVSKSRVMEGFAIAFLVTGPSGMETMARAVADYEWIEPEKPATFPIGWTNDHTLLNAGLDYSTSTMSKAELALLEGWYEETIGEVPPYVRLLGELKPDLLKAWRNRYENCIHELPIQSIPLTLLHYEVCRGFPDGIRENVLLARAFGVTKDETMGVISSAMSNGGTAGVSTVERAVGDVLYAWED